jgi:hypothetical protein
MPRPRLTARRATLPLVGMVVALAATVGAATGPGSAMAGRGQAGPQRDTQAERTYTVGLFGDMPYNAIGKAQYPALLADINAHHVTFSFFDGDLKAGGDGPCSDSLYTTALANFNTLRHPLIWVPGDNDWTDCWGRYGPATAPFFDPEERLAHERQVFAATSQSLGQETLTLTRQSSEGGAFAAYRENVRFTAGPVVFIGLNVQGSNDNLPHAGVDGETRSPAEIDRQTAEHEARLAANVHWLDESFAVAARRHAKGVMIVWQADPDFNNEQALPDPRSYDGYPEIIAALRRNTMAFPGQVALVHGDSHYFKVDKPLNGDNGAVLANFTRVETFGARNTHWVSATIDPSDPNVFTFRPMIVPANAG